jgi:hypothetical protein
MMYGSTGGAGAVGNHTVLLAFDTVFLNLNSAPNLHKLKNRASEQPISQHEDGRSLVAGPTATTVSNLGSLGETYGRIRHLRLTTGGLRTTH